MRRILLPLLLIACAAGCGGNTIPNTPPPAAAGDITLTPITVAELNKTVASHKGKVVLIDCWFYYCGPCKKKFPRVVQLHHDFAADGLVLMTLDVVPEEWEEKEKVLKFLTDQKADFPHYIFATRQQGAVEAWQLKYDAEYTPQFVAFDRQGKWVRTPKFHAEGTPEEKEAAHAAAEREFVKQLLAR